METERDNIKNELRNRVVAKIENTSYSLIFYDYSWEHFGNSVVIIKKITAHIIKGLYVTVVIYF